VETIQRPRHKALVKIISDKRKRAGLRQADLAKLLNKPQTSVSYIEGGQRRIDVVEFLDLAAAIGFDPHQVLRKLLRIKE